MNTYYIAGYPVSDELYHHGIKGQKWGVRRYQNEDGSLTPAGRERYGKNLGEYGTGKQGVIRKFATGDWLLGNKQLGERREQWYKNRIEKRQSEGKSTHQLENKYEIQKARNIGRDLYNSRASTGKLVAQALLLGEAGADSYRSARGRGRDVGEAAVGAILGQVIGLTLSPLGGSATSYLYDYDDTRRQVLKNDRT